MSDVTYLTTPIVEVRNDPPPRGSGLTRDGYTKRSGAPTARMIRLQGEKRWRRLMVWHFSNLGTMFVNIGGKPHVVREEMLPEEGSRGHATMKATKKSKATLDRKITEAPSRTASSATGHRAHAAKKLKKAKKARIVNVEASTPTGYRWLRINARGATLTPEGFAVTDEHEWAQSLNAAGAHEISINDVIVAPKAGAPGIPKARKALKAKKPPERTSPWGKIDTASDQLPWRNSYANWTMRVGEAAAKHGTSIAFGSETHDAWKAGVSPDAYAKASAKR